jgi:hypothetical protein
MFSILFWQNVLERAVKTAAQAAVLAAGGGMANLFSLDWRILVGAAAGGALLSVLTSLGSEALPFGNVGTASLTKAVETSAVEASPEPSGDVSKHAAGE